MSNMKFKPLNENCANLHIIQLAPFMKQNSLHLEKQSEKNSPNYTPLKTPALNSQQLSPLVTSHSLSQRSILKQTKKNFQTKLSIALKGMPKLFDEKLNNEPAIIQPLKNSDLLLEKGLKFQFRDLIQSQQLPLTKEFSPRLEVIELSQWLDEQLQKIEKLSKTSINEDSDIFKSCQKIITIAMSELHRQISVECKERGDLFQMAWNWFIGMTDQMIEQLSIKNVYIEKNSLKKILNLHESYQNEIKVLNEDLSRSKLEYQKMNEEVKNIQRELQKLQITNSTFNRQALKYRSQYNKILKLFQLENKENVFMLNRICHIDFDKIVALKSELFNTKDIYSYSQQRHSFLEKKYQELFKNQIFDEINLDLYGVQFQTFIKRTVKNIKQQALSEVDQGEDNDLSYMSPLTITNLTNF